MTKTARGLGLTYKNAGGLIHLSGYIDECVDYSPLLSTDPPLRLNLRKIVGINSIGVRKWSNFIKALGVSALEFHECPPSFIDLVNIIPDVVSTIGNMKRIKSVVVPCVCPTCKHECEQVVQVTEVVPESPALPFLPCSKCGRPLESSVFLGDHFFFLRAED